MWEMLDDDVHCDECGGGPGPPPKFLIPPPPRPPFMHELTKCSAEDSTSKDYDMCEAIPILDASYHSSPSLQTSAMVAVFSLLLVLVVLISSLFVWKHKRKVQNFLPCKTPTRGSHLSGGVSSGHAVTYEDPDAHLGHRPLVMRHHNVEMLPPKSIHYPSGYPMTRTPPLFVCSSPGPDPYRSNDNVYEELGPGRDSDCESNPPLHSDDDFAEDELSLPGERNFHKSVTDSVSLPVATIYHERISSSSNNNSSGISTGGHERNSLISSSSSSNNTTAPITDQQQQQQRTGVLAGIVRPLTTSLASRKNHRLHPTNNVNGIGHFTSNKNNSNRKNGFSSTIPTTTDDMNTSSEQTTESDIVPSVYDVDRNLMSLTFNNHHHHHPHQQQQQLYYANNSLASSNNNNNSSLSGNSHSNNNNNNSSGARLHCFTKSTPGLTAVDSEVERRNRINKQLHHPPVVSTIFRERGHYNNTPPPLPALSIHRQQQQQLQQYPQPYYSQYSLLSNQHHQPSSLMHRSRTNPRSLDRRRIAVPIDHESNYGYAEPVFHEGLIYDACLAHPNNTTPFRTPPYPYIVPECGPTFRTLGNGVQHYHHNGPQQQHQDLLLPQIYSRDSSFGSDSGYSHHTPISGIGCGGPGTPGNTTSSLVRSDSGNASNSTGNSSCGRTNSSSGGCRNSSGGKSGLNFGWNRRGRDNCNSSGISTTTTTPSTITAVQTTTTTTLTTIVPTSLPNDLGTTSANCPVTVNSNTPNNNNNSNGSCNSITSGNNNNPTTNPSNTSSSSNNCNNSKGKSFEDS